MSTEKLLTGFNISALDGTEQPYILDAVVDIPLKYSIIPPNYIIKVYNQAGNTCVSYAIAQYIRIISNDRLLLSPMYHYYITRLRDKMTIQNDSGLGGNSMFTVLYSFGLCPESIWPYKDDTSLSVMPSTFEFRNNSQWTLFKTFMYSIIIHQNKSPAEVAMNVKKYLVISKQPLLVALRIPSSNDNFYRRNNYDLQNDRGFMLATNVYGTLNNTVTYDTHMMVLIAYDDNMKNPNDPNNIPGYVTFINSWSENTGDKGLYHIPYEYFFAQGTILRLYDITYTL